MDFTSGHRITTPARLPLPVPESIGYTVIKILLLNWIGILPAVFWSGISCSPRVGHSFFPDGLLGSGVRRTRPSLSANLRERDGRHRSLNITNTYVEGIQTYITPFEGCSFIKMPYVI
jgi:hypothetical protein